jgi:serine/alanine adding enzyme
LTSLKIVNVDGQEELWDSFVTSAPGSTFSHLAGWKGIMTDVLRHECHYLAAVDGAGTWRGILPLVHVRSLLGNYLISMPFLNDGGPLGDTAAQQLLVEYALGEADRQGASLLELRARDQVPGPVTPTNRKISVHLALPPSVEELWRSILRTKQRTKIRRAVKEGMVFRSGSSELAGFYDVFARNMRDLGTPVLPRAFFDRLASIFGSRAMFANVYTSEGVPVACACCLRWRNELEVTWGSSLREFNHLSPNMLLYSRLMEEAIGEGIEVFNFGRCTPGGGTHAFKQQWGGRDVPLPWPSWYRQGGSGVPTTSRPMYRLATKVWANLPVPIANRLGPMLARLLP